MEMANIVKILASTVCIYLQKWQKKKTISSFPIMQWGKIVEQPRVFKLDRAISLREREESSATRHLNMYTLTPF